MGAAELQLPVRQWLLLIIILRFRSCNHRMDVKTQHAVEVVSFFCFFFGLVGVLAEGLVATSFLDAGRLTKTRARGAGRDSFFY